MTDDYVGLVPAAAHSRGSLVVLAALMLAVAASCSGTEAKPDPAPKPPHVVFYAEGTGTTTGAVTLVSESGGTVQKDVKLPAVDETTGTPGIASDAFKSGARLYISLQNKEASGKVTCRIEVDGKVIDQATSEGGYKIAACRGQVP